MRHTQRVLGYSTFVETGTFLGDMACYAGQLFSEVHSIELSPELYRDARTRVSMDNHITVHLGDSGDVLREVLPGIDVSCVFWLDGHYSGGITAHGEKQTPIIAELRAIEEHHIRPHAILIDDARVFGADDAYPTIEEVAFLLRKIDPSFKIGVSSDIIWAAPIKLLHFEWKKAPDGTVVRPRTQ
jgi:hypothetical protein